MDNYKLSILPPPLEPQQSCSYTLGKQCCKHFSPYSKCWKLSWSQVYISWQDQSLGPQYSDTFLQDHQQNQWNSCNIHQESSGQYFHNPEFQSHWLRVSIWFQCSLHNQPKLQQYLIKIDSCLMLENIVFTHLRQSYLFAFGQLEVHYILEGDFCQSQELHSAVHQTHWILLSESGKEMKY